MSLDRQVLGRDVDRSPSGRALIARVGPPLALGAALVGYWQYATTRYDVPAVVFPSPLEVATAAVATYPTLLSAALVTATTAGLGLAIGAALGFGLAFAMVESRAFRAVGLPFVVGLRIAPVIAIAPLVFLWVGRGMVARALVVATLTQFPIVVATLDGLRSVPREYVDLLRSVDAPPGRIFLRVRIPAAASSIAAGVKVAATLSIVGAVVAEFVTLEAGLGALIFEWSVRLRTAEMYAALAVLAAVGLGFYLAAVAGERLLARRGH